MGIIMWTLAALVTGKDQWLWVVTGDRLWQWLLQSFPRRSLAHKMVCTCLQVWKKKKRRYMKNIFLFDLMWEICCLGKATASWGTGLPDPTNVCLMMGLFHCKDIGDVCWCFLWQLEETSALRDLSSTLFHGFSVRFIFWFFVKPHLFPRT